MEKEINKLFDNNKDIPIYLKKHTSFIGMNKKYYISRKSNQIYNTSSYLILVKPYKPF